MKAFHNDINIKEKYMVRLEAHAKADEFIKGKYWEGGRGCAVGCTIHGSDHKKYETELGIPEWLARVEDTIFEGLPLDKAKQWPIDFLSAISVGAYLEQIKTPFLVFICEQALETLLGVSREHPTNILKVIDDSRKAIVGVIDCLKSGNDAYAAADSAEAARAAARAASAAADSADSAEAARAASAAADAARAASAAADAAEAASAAAYSARAAAYSARAAAHAAAHEKYAEKLLGLIKECK